MTEQGLPTDLDIDFLPLGADQPEGWDLATLPAVTGWQPAVEGLAPALTETPFGSEQTYDLPTFRARYLRLTVNDAYNSDGTVGGLRQIAFQATDPIPEPGTVLLLVIGMAAAACCRRRRRALPERARDNHRVEEEPNKRAPETSILPAGESWAREDSCRTPWPCGPRNSDRAGPA